MTERHAIMPYNGIKRLLPPSLGRQDGKEEDEEKRHFYILSLPAGSILAPLCLSLLGEDLAERREATLLQFPPPLLFTYYLFFVIYLLPVLLRHCVPSFYVDFSFKLKKTDDKEWMLQHF